MYFMSVNTDKQSTSENKPFLHNDAKREKPNITRSPIGWLSFPEPIKLRATSGLLRLASL